MWTYALLADSGPVALDAERSAGLAGSLSSLPGPDSEDKAEPFPEHHFFSVAEMPARFGNLIIG